MPVVGACQPLTHHTGAVGSAAIQVRMEKESSTLRSTVQLIGMLSDEAIHWGGSLQAAFPLKVAVRCSILPCLRHLEHNATVLDLYVHGTPFGRSQAPADTFALYC